MSVFATSLFFSFSSAGTAIAKTVPIWSLIAFQSFRFPLELVLHSWAMQGTVPIQMTWTGQNWDILTGVAALLLFWPARTRPRIAWVFSGIGIALLINVIRVALLSAPVPFGWHLDRPLLVALHLPYALIGTVCVAAAISGHILLIRAMLHIDSLKGYNQKR